MHQYPDNRVTLVNLTPHPITLLTTSGSVTLPPSGTVARAEETRVWIGVMVTSDDRSIPITRVAYGAATDLPDPREGYGFIVSRVTAAACPQRTDLFIPDEIVRDPQGTIIGCRALARL